MTDGEVNIGMDGFAGILGLLGVFVSMISTEPLKPVSSIDIAVNYDEVNSM